MSLLNKKEKQISSGVLLSFLGAIITYVILFPAPQLPIWDEVYHIPAATKYIHGVLYQEPHPPLGKEIIALGEWMFGENEHIDPNPLLSTDKISKMPEGFSYFGVRFFPLLAAVFVSPLLFLATFLITSSYWISLLPAMMYIFDNALVLHSRGAMLDGIQLFFVIAQITFGLWMWRSKDVSIRNLTFLWALWWAAVAVKFNALSAVVFLLFGLIPLLQNFWKYRAKLWRKYLMRIGMAILAICVGAFGIFFASFYIHWALSIRVAQNNTDDFSPSYLEALERQKLWNPIHTFTLIWDWLKFSEKYARGVTKWGLCTKWENGSFGATWPFGHHPIHYRWEKINVFPGYPNVLIDKPHESLPVNDLGIQYIRSQTLTPNPWSWWSVIFGGIMAIGALMGAVMSRKLELKSSRMLSVGILACFYFGYLIAVCFVDRVLYLYHYLLPLVVGFILFACIFEQLTLNYFAKNKAKKRWGKVIYCLFVTWVLAAFIFYAPFTYYLPMNQKALDARNAFLLSDIRAKFDASSSSKKGSSLSSAISSDTLWKTK